MKRVLVISGLLGAIAITSAFAARPRRTAKAVRPTPAADRIAFNLPDPGLQPGTYQGTRVKPDPNAQGAALTLQQEIARKFAKLDPQSAQRKTHFAWLDKPEFGLRGWGGQITDVAQAPNGLVVKVAITPIVVSQFGASTTVLDHVAETYLYSGGALQLLNSDANLNPPRESFITD